MIPAPRNRRRPDATTPALGALALLLAPALLAAPAAASHHAGHAPQVPFGAAHCDGPVLRHLDDLGGAPSGLRRRICEVLAWVAAQAEPAAARALDRIGGLPPPVPDPW